ncbi:uncharacterized protein LOC142572060 [Dermacentor variabilis]|uniref:uncharacterized protein LOC142572060 n=1 Tax=Dermacentor variabilis TaxID=34621 RepID=UPI003F5AFD06
MGNVILAASILFTGSSPTQVLRVLQSAGIACFTKRTYDRLQRDLLILAVHKLWEREKRSLLSCLSSTGAQLAGDSRADSPGYCAKYGTYSLLDTSLNRVIDVQLVQSNEVTNSGAMELEGLKRALKALDDGKIHVNELVTDRHTQVRSHMQRERPGVTHLIDAWHVAKGLKKKLQAVSRSRGCGLIEEWITSIINHFYYSVKIGAGRGELAVAVWKSFLNHVQNKHCNHSDDYPHCEHGDLLPRKWIFAGTDSFVKLQKIVENRRLIIDIKQVSPSCQTSNVESFHSLINRFAPKSFTFSFYGMLARSQLAALHYNENADRSQGRTSVGERQWTVKHPKARKGKAVACPVKEPPTYEYVGQLLEIVEDLVESNRFGAAHLTALPPVPPPLTSRFEAVDKVDLVQDHLSRFAPREHHPSGLEDTDDESL